MKKPTHFHGWLLVSLCGLFGVTLLFLSLVYPPGVKIVVLASLGIAMLVVLFKHTHGVILCLLFLGPFSDSLITLFLSNVPLIGIWRDLIIIGIVVKGVWLSLRPGFQWRFTWLDYAVCIFILVYAFSIVPSPNLAVWLFGFRWYTVYAFLYLALKAYRFTTRELTQILIATLSGLLLSAAIGFVLLQILGDQALSALWEHLFKAGGFWRGGHFRWQGTFTSPIVASISFAFVLIASVAHLLERKSLAAYLPVALVGAYALYLTFTRTGWAVGVAGVLAVVLLVAKRLHSYKILVTASLVVGLSLVVAVSLNPEVLDIATQRNRMDSYRLETFETVITDAFVYPFGVGVGTAGAMAIAAMRFGGSNMSVTPVVGDSVLLAVLRDTGWIGLFSLLAISVGFIMTAYKGFCSAASKEERIFALAYFGFTIGILTGLMDDFDVWPVAFYFWLFGALVVAIVEGRVDNLKNTSSRCAEALMDENPGVN